jgi:NitT/TauT family transport system substrate-binding protein
MNNRPTRCVFAVLVLLAWVFPARRLAAADTPSLRGVYNALGGTMTPAWIAQDLGLFTKHGLQHSLSYLAATTAIQAIVGGTEDIGLVGNQGVDVALEGADTVYIANTAARFVFHLYGDPAIKTVADLKGKTIAVTTPKTSTEIATREALKKSGIISDKDVSFLYVQTIPAILTAIISAKTAAGTLSAPNTIKAHDSGLNLLIDIAQANVPGIHLAYGTIDKTIKTAPNSLYAFVKAVSEATVLAKQNPGIAKKAISKYTETDDAKIIDGTYEQFSPYWESNIAVRPEPVQGQLSYLDEKEFPRVRDARPADFIENLFADSLKSSGFLQSIGVSK